tara:strand:+ start:9135 stop:10988 length:1854 start_codon:yes stop_codon:yes gene_type:complete
MKPQNIPILMYHDVSNHNNQWCITPENFSKQMQYLAENGYKTCSLTQLHQFLNQKQDLTQKYVVITFDDGRESVYTKALPILNAYGFKATLYLVPEWMEGRNIPEEENYSNFLTWDQVNQLKEAGFEIGSHTYSHANLTTTNDLKNQLQTADEIIQQKIGSKVEHFCYPYGKYNRTILEEVNKRYTTAITVNQGFSKQSGEYARQWILNNTDLATFQQLLNKPTLSVCMIVKNEAKHLEMCLKSIKDLGDELIVVDTGSSDNTKQIAAKYTEKVHDFDWVNDFSAARNFSLKQATSDWIFVIDADEVLNKKDHRRIKQAINYWQISGFNLCTKNYGNDSSISSWQPCTNTDLFSTSFAGWHPSIKIRLFQKGPQFAGTVHEQIKLAKAPLLPVYIHHHQGFSDNNKSQVYLDYTKNKLKQNPEDAKILFELGIQQKQLEDYANAEISLQQAANLEQNSILPLLNLAIVQQKQGKIDLAMQNYHRILERKQHPEAYFGLGYCNYQQNNLQLAQQNFSKSLELNPRYVDAYINLGAIYEQQDKYEQAASSLRQAIKLHPKNAQAYYNFAIMHEKTQNLPHAITCYQKAIEFNHPKKQQTMQRIKEIQTFIQKNSSLSSE